MLKTSPAMPNLPLYKESILLLMLWKLFTDGFIVKLLSTNEMTDLIPSQYSSQMRCYRKHGLRKVILQRPGSGR